MKSAKAKLRFAVMAAVVLFCIPAIARSYRIADFDDSIVVSKDGSAIVTEKIALVFVGQYSGIHRYIPVSYSSGPEGTTNYTLFIDVLSVNDSGGSSLKYEKKTEKGNLALTIYI